MKMFNLSMSDLEFKRRVTEALRSRSRKEVRSPHLDPAAVLMPLYEKGDSLHVLFTKRTDRVAHHKSQISFPGGMKDRTDKDLLHTALRESAEEIGLDCGIVQVLGVLDDTPTLASNFIITPYVAFLDRNPELKLNLEEVHEVIEVPMQELFVTANFREENQEFADGPHPVYFFQHGPHVIWGATARMVKNFVDVVRPVL